MTRCILLAGLLLAFSSGPATRAAASADQTSVAPKPDPALQIGFKRVIQSKILDEDRELFVYLPNGYKASGNKKRYPLFVVLDGRMNFKATASMIHSLSEGGVIPRMIVVGVANTHRWRDLTPVPGMGIPGTGGGDGFLSCLASEILPYIDENWRTNGFRVFSGHSLGGLTSLHVLRERPRLFDAHIALSPSLEWDDGFLVDRYVTLFENAPSLDRMLYLAIADERLERIYCDRLIELLRTKAPPELLWTSEVFEDQDDHMSIRVTGALAGIRWVFRDWRLTSKRIYGMSEQQIEEHYAQVTRRYKEPRALNMMQITDAGYWGLYDPKTVDRAMGLFRLAIRKWPDRAYPYSCLGEGLERTGKPEQALEQMEHALQLAKDTGEQDLPYYQGMVDRVRTALGRSAEPVPSP